MFCQDYSTINNVYNFLIEHHSYSYVFWIAEYESDIKIGPSKFLIC